MSKPQPEQPGDEAQNLNLHEILFIGCGGTVVALRESDGKELWRRAIQHGCTNLAKVGDRLIFTSGSNVWCLNPFNGETIWTTCLTVEHMGNSPAKIVG